MTDTKKVYVVTKGAYSDYGICAIFDNLEAAEAYIAAAKPFERMRDFNDVEEWELNSTVPPYKVVYTVRINATGEVESQTADLRWDETTEPPDRVDCYPMGDDGVVIYARSYRSYNVALKAAHDKLAQWKAEQTGV